MEQRASALERRDPAERAVEPILSELRAQVKKLTCMKALLPLLVCISISAVAQDEETPRGGRGGGSGDPRSSSTFSGLTLRGIGPAFTSGRISTFAVDPENSQRYFVAVPPGSMWKTNNDGASWIPLRSQGPTEDQCHHHLIRNPSHHLSGTATATPACPGDGVIRARTPPVGKTDFEEDPSPRKLVDPGIPGIRMLAAPTAEGRGGGCGTRRRQDLVEHAQSGRVLRRRRPDHGSARESRHLLAGRQLSANGGISR